MTHTALHPWYTGYLVHTLRAGETYYRLAAAYGTSVHSIAVANPELDPMRLEVGARLVIPLPFDVVPTDISVCSALVAACCEGISARYPEIKQNVIGWSVMGEPLRLLSVGEGDHRVLYNAAHHGNEWITTTLLLKFTEDLARAYAFEEEIFGRSARVLLEGCELAIMPCVNPDGVDLAAGELRTGVFFAGAEEIAARYPAIPFPSGWKANILGVDPNLQYPAGWEQAREIKFAQGFRTPAPRDYVGEAPLTAPESLALYLFTRAFSPDLTLSYHTQGRVIYWKYQDYNPPRSRAIAARFSEVSGYFVEETPFSSGFAGYKDWFIQTYNRPGYTIEAGIGDNPLPISQFDTIYRENIGILTEGLFLARE